MLVMVNSKLRKDKILSHIFKKIQQIIFTNKKASELKENN
jgi:hypothetical protein